MEASERMEPDGRRIRNRWCSCAAGARCSASRSEPRRRRVASRPACAAAAPAPSRCRSTRARATSPSSPRPGRHRARAAGDRPRRNSAQRASRRSTTTLAAQVDALDAQEQAARRAGAGGTRSHRRCRREAVHAGRRGPSERGDRSRVRADRHARPGPEPAHPREVGRPTSSTCSRRTTRRTRASRSSSRRHEPAATMTQSMTLDDATDARRRTCRRRSPRRAAAARGRAGRHRSLPPQRRRRPRARSWVPSLLSAGDLAAFLRAHGGEAEHLRVDRRPRPDLHRRGPEGRRTRRRRLRAVDPRDRLVRVRRTAWSTRKTTTSPASARATPARAGSGSPTPAAGVRAQVQLLRVYVDPTVHRGSLGEPLLLPGTLRLGFRGRRAVLVGSHGHVGDGLQLRQRGLRGLQPHGCRQRPALTFPSRATVNPALKYPASRCRGSPR